MSSKIQINRLESQSDYCEQKVADYVENDQTSSSDDGELDQPGMALFFGGFKPIEQVKKAHISSPKMPKKQHDSMNEIKLIKGASSFEGSDMT